MQTKRVCGSARANLPVCFLTFIRHTSQHGSLRLFVFFGRHQSSRALVEVFDHAGRFACSWQGREEAEREHEQSQLVGE